MNHMDATVQVVNAFIDEVDCARRPIIESETSSKLLFIARLVRRMLINLKKPVFVSFLELPDMKMSEGMCTTVSFCAWYERFTYS